MKIVHIKVVVRPSGDTEASIQWYHGRKRPQLTTAAEEAALTAALDDLVKRRRHAARAHAAA